MNNTPFFVAGITGQVGGAAARKLLKQGHQVRTLARDPQKAAEWAKQGVEVRQGDLNDPTAVAAAQEGVQGAFLLMPPHLAHSPGFPEAKATISSYREALQQSPPPRLVLLSSIGSEQNSGLGNITSTHLMEEALGDLPFPIAIVRAGGFIENFKFSLPRAQSSGWLDSFWTPTDRPFPMIATADIGNQVADLLTNPWDGKKIVELGSPVSADDLAHAMTEVLGRSVQARAIPREQWSAALEAMGFSPGTTGSYEEMMDGFNSGWIHFGVHGTEPIAGTTSPAQVFAQMQKA